MSEQSGSSQGQQERTELPIERGFPIERVNEIAAKESRAGMHYRPIYTMHKWWARRLGCVFRAISLYTLLDDANSTSVRHLGKSGSSTLDTGRSSKKKLKQDIASVSAVNPDSLWDYYSKDVTVENKKVLDPFMGGGTSVVEASRFDADVLGNDLNPVAWFVTKKEIEAGNSNPDELHAAFETLKDEVAGELKSYYRTDCPNGNHSADVMYYLWAKELDCTSCGDTVPLFNDYRVGKGRYDHKDEYSVFCPDCNSVVRVDDWQSESMCSECGYAFTPKNGSTAHGKYTCRSCGQKYSVTDAVEEQEGFEFQLYALEYHCYVCDEDPDAGKSDSKGYKSAEYSDIELFEDAQAEWERRDDLNSYIPSEEIPEGAITASSSISGNDLFRHGYEKWTDMYNERQLLCLSKLLKAIDEIEDENAREYLLLAFSDALRTNCMLTTYTHARNSVEHIFKTNSFAPPAQTVDANVWGAEYGRGTFSSIWDMVMSGVEYAQSPTERHIVDGETVETGEFETSLGKTAEVIQGDVRNIDAVDEYDAVITDPPYYDNIIYSEVSDYFYVWLKILLEDTYSGFDKDKTPRTDSIVTNPYLNKTAEDFESELEQSFSVIRRAIKEEGSLTFTYHHSDSDSWGELLESLCNVGFEVTATYPISADIGKFIQGEAVSFDIIVVARPIDDTEPASWNSLRRDIYRTARRTRQQLEENRDLSRGDIGVMEMGACFREYSMHHGKVQRDGEIMTAKEVVQEIYGIIQEASDIGVEDVFIDLLDTPDVSYDDVNKLCRGTNATPDDLKKMRLYNQDDGFELGTWDNEKRQAYIQERVNGDGGDHLSNLDKLQFLRYRYEKGQSVQNYVEKWDVDDDLRELAGRLADVTGDDTYTRVLGDRDITSY
jgi:adenine-specific DNA methylase